MFWFKFFGWRVDFKTSFTAILSVASPAMKRIAANNQRVNSNTNQMKIQQKKNQKQ